MRRASLSKFEIGFIRSLLGAVLKRKSYHGGPKKQTRPASQAGFTRGTQAIYSFDGRLLAEYDIYGESLKDYIYMGARLVAEFKPATAQYFYYTQDQIGSTRVVTNDAGAVVYAEAHDPYGGIQKTWINTFEPKRKFSDKERDEETGLDYFGARYYCSLHYRFITVDPVLNKTGAIAIPQLANLYSYCRNNPITYIDPFGLDNYIFYDPFNFSLQSLVEENRLRRKDPDEPIHRIAITSEEQFIIEWNSMVNPTDVTLIFHSGSGAAAATTMSIRAEKGEYLTTNPMGHTPSQASATYVGSLEKKTINKLVLYVCHAGDTRVEDNLARTFFYTQNIMTVQASPGYVNFNNPLINSRWTLPERWLPAYAPKDSTKWVFWRR